MYASLWASVNVTKKEFNNGQEKSISDKLFNTFARAYSSFAGQNEKNILGNNYFKNYQKARVAIEDVKSTLSLNDRTFISSIYAIQETMKN